jgi:hypothetical protein
MLQIAALFRIRMRSVIGRKDVDRSVADGIAQCAYVVLETQWRIHLCARAEFLDMRFGEDQMMRRNLTAQLYARVAFCGIFRPTDDLNSVGG